MSQSEAQKIHLLKYHQNDYTELYNIKADFRSY